MASFRIEFQRSAEKDLRRLGREHLPRILGEIKKLESNSFPPGVRKLAGSDLTYRIRVGDYRIIYQALAGNLIVITRIRHRREVYRD